MSELTPGHVFKTDFRRAGSTGIIQVVHGDSDVHLFGSLDNDNYVLIETFVSSTIKEIALCTYFKFSTDAANADATAVTTTKLILEETIGG